MRHLPLRFRISTVEEVLALPSVTFSDKRHLPDAPGVYFVLQEDAQVIYVGATWGSLKRRWLQHDKTRGARREGAIRIAYMVCESDLFRNGAEEFAIFSLQPPLNIHYKQRQPHFWPKGKPRKQPPATER